MRRGERSTENVNNHCLNAEIHIFQFPFTYILCTFITSFEQEKEYQSTFNVFVINNVFVQAIDFPSGSSNPSGSLS